MAEQKDAAPAGRRRIALAVVLLLLLCGGAVIGLNWNAWFGTPPSAAEQTTAPEIDPNAKAWQGQQPTAQGGADTGIQIPGYPSLALPANTRDVQVALLNPEGNPCYFTFTLLLQETGEVLYTSKLVPPGQAVYQISLSRPLEAGEYDAVIRIATTALTDGSPMNGADVKTVLVVR